MAGQVQADGVATAEERFQVLFARVASSPVWIRRVSEEITEAIHRELPELGGDEDLRAETFASTRSILTLMADLVRLGRPASDGVPPPDADEYARDFVRRGLPVDVLLRAYHVGQATFFTNWVAGVHAEVTDPVWLAQAVELGAAWTFEYVHTLSRALVRRYSDEHERWVRSAAALRADTVRALLDGERIDHRLAAQRLRYELDRHHVAYIVWTEDEDAGPADFAALEHAATQLAADGGLGPALVVALGGQLVAAWAGAQHPVDLHGSAVPGPALAAVGSPGEGVDGFCSGHREAMHARRVARLTGRRPGSVTRYDDIALTALASIDVDLAREYVARELGPLAGDDDESARLAGTLRVYLEERASPRHTAQRLGIHENTVKNRVRSIRDLLGHAPEDRVADLLVALRLAAITRP
jgi:transposase-like protein